MLLFPMHSPMKNQNTTSAVTREFSHASWNNKIRNTEMVHNPALHYTSCGRKALSRQIKNMKDKKYFTNINQT
jgi:hypothetical protein